MKRNKILSSLSIGILLSFSSCNDFLDKEPDNRVAINTPDQVVELLTNAYFDGNYTVICELSSDNIIDNNAPHTDVDSKKTVYYNLSSWNRTDDEAFAFEPVKSSMAQDSPSAVWSGCYGAIAVANHALEAIARLEAEGVSDPKLDGAKGEAYLIRAYNHFILVNIFSQAYRNEELSKLDAGIPYVTDPETKVSVHYDRGTVADVYKKIEEDLLKGLQYVRDNNYTVPKYHFNSRAAHAFAARYYLFTREYGKVLEHANAVLGESTASAKSNLMNWMPFEGSATGEDYSNVWLDPDQNNNIMLVSTTSWAQRVFGAGYRYACNGEAAMATLNREGPTWRWTIIPWVMASGAFSNQGQEYGILSGKIIERFEYTDKTALTGYGHIVRREFTCAELMLCRIEAKLLGPAGVRDVPGAIADLIAYEENRQEIPAREQYSKGGTAMFPLTEEIIKEYYTKEKHPEVVLDYNTTLMSPDFVIDPEVKPYFDCMMDFRRCETIFEGLRFFDLKRFGIEYSHVIGKDARKVTLTWNDPRRALEAPQEVLAAGFESSLGSPMKALSEAKCYSTIKE